MELSKRRVKKKVFVKCYLSAESQACATDIFRFGEKGPFRCLVEPRPDLHFLPNAVDLVRFIRIFKFADILFNMIKIISSKD